MTAEPSGAQGPTRSSSAQVPGVPLRLRVDQVLIGGPPYAAARASIRAIACRRAATMGKIMAVERNSALLHARPASIVGARPGADVLLRPLLDRREVCNHPGYAPPRRDRLAVEEQLIDDAPDRGWDREVERHQRVAGRIHGLLAELEAPCRGRFPRRRRASE